MNNTSTQKQIHHPLLTNLVKEFFTAADNDDFISENDFTAQEIKTRIKKLPLCLKNKHNYTGTYDLYSRVTGDILISDLTERNVISLYITAGYDVIAHLLSYK